MVLQVMTYVDLSSLVVWKFVANDNYPDNDNEIQAELFSPTMKFDARFQEPSQFESNDENVIALHVSCAANFSLYFSTRIN